MLLSTPLVESMGNFVDNLVLLFGLQGLNIGEKVSRGSGPSVKMPPLKG